MMESEEEMGFLALRVSRDKTGFPVHLVYLATLACTATWVPKEDQGLPVTEGNVAKLAKEGEWDHPAIEGHLALTPRRRKGPIV